jgi:hypothetical protein
VFVTVGNFHPIIIFAGKDGGYPSEAVMGHSKGRLQPCLQILDKAGKTQC